MVCLLRINKIIFLVVLLKERKWDMLAKYFIVRSNNGKTTSIILSVLSFLEQMLYYCL